MPGDVKVLVIDPGGTSRIFDHVAWVDIDAVDADASLALADHAETRAAIVAALQEVTLDSALMR